MPVAEHNDIIQALPPDRADQPFRMASEFSGPHSGLPIWQRERIDVLSPRMIRIIENLSGDWRRLDERIQHVTEEIEALAYGSGSC